MTRIDGENWLRLHLAARDTVRVRSLVKKYGTATALIEKEPNMLFSEGEIDSAILGKLVFARSAEMTGRIDETVELCRKNGWRIITPQSSLYPEQLLSLRRFPFVLYADGDAELLNLQHKCSMVGTRNASKTARTVAFKFAYGLSQLGVSVVSGGALGIDAASHEGALAGKTGTVGVLGAGFGTGYLQQNEDLRRRISRHGVLISELHPFESPSKYTFPERNRIIASLGNACLVVESGANGGSLITAECARESGRQVFIPHREIAVSDGCKRLLLSGASETDSPADLFARITGAKAEERELRGIPASAKPDYDIDFSLPEFKRFFFGESDNFRSIRRNEKTKYPKQNSRLYKPDEKDRTNKNGKIPKNVVTAPDRPEKNLFTQATEPTLFTVAPVTESENNVLAVLTETPVSFDKIVEITGLGTDVVSSSLTLLELRGEVSSYYGNLYSLKANAKAMH